MKTPNLLFIFSDQQHWRACGYKNNFFTTPNQDLIAQDGFVFNNAFCTTPQCSPSRSSILTGYYPSKTGVWGNIGKAGGRNLKQATIGKMLQQNGYSTGYVGKWHLGNDGLGTDGWDESRFLRVDSITEFLARGFLRRWKRNKKQPFALFVSFNNPHHIYQYPGNKLRIKTTKADLPGTWNRQTFTNRPKCHQEFMKDDQGKIIHGKPVEEWIRYHDWYKKKNKNYDSKLGRIVRRLKRMGEYDNTLIIITSDHGDMDTNHGLIFKGPFMYEHMVRIPLIIKPPVGHAKFQQQPGHSDFHTINTDLVPTILDICGIEDPERGKRDGFSLKPLLSNKKMEDKHEFIIGQYYSKQKWVNPIRMLRTGDYKYNLYIVENSPQEYFEELYDLNADPDELSNLAYESEYKDIKTDLRQKLDKWIEENDDPFYSQIKTDRDGRPT